MDLGWSRLAPGQELAATGRARGRGDSFHDAGDHPRVWAGSTGGIRGEGGHSASSHAVLPPACRGDSTQAIWRRAAEMVCLFGAGTRESADGLAVVARTKRSRTDLAVERCPLVVLADTESFEGGASMAGAGALCLWWRGDIHTGGRV